MVVTAARGDRVAASQQLSDLATVCQRGLDLASYFGIGWVRFHDAQHVGERVDQFFSQRPVPGPDQLELLLRLHVKRAIRFENISARSSRACALHQAQQQRVALGRRDVLQLGGVQHLGLTSKVADLRWCQPREQRTLVAEQLQPGQVRDEIV